MAKARSPQYPVISLREAVEKVADIYKEDYQNPISRGVAAQHMGYKTLNGKSLGVLSALGKYGLLEGRGDNTRVSDLAVRIIAHEPGTSERGAAIQEAAAAPDLFRELSKRYPAGRASEGAIRAYLLTQKFIPSAADSVVRSYRDTLEFVATEFGEYNLDSEPQSESSMHATEAALQTPPPVSRIPSSVDARHSPPASTREIANIRVSKDCAIRLLADGPYSKRSIEALVKNLELQLELGTYDDSEEESES